MCGGMNMRFQREKNELKKLVKVFSENLPYYLDTKNNFNEQMTRQQYIDVFLRIIGWDISNPQGLSFREREIVAEEYSSASTKDRPDYTIRMNGMSKFFVEAKKVSKDISSDHESALQARRYGWNAGHDISVLTNFEYLAIYLTYEMPLEGESVSRYRYKLYHYTEYENNFEEIYRLISRESVLNGNFDKWIRKIRPEEATKRSLDNVFLEQLNEWRVLVANDLIVQGYDMNSYGDLNESIQTFLNQLVFLRFVEDNKYETLYKLKEEILKHENYKEYFKELDSKYNSELFLESKIINDLSNEALTKIVDDLYFPNVSYDFSVIELSILSKIYENFLQEEIVVIDGIARLEKTKSAKIKSVKSTPDEVVNAIVKQALDPLVKDKSIDEILELKIADIAVGSGIFLIEVYNYLEQHLVDLYTRTNNLFPDEKLVPFSVKKQLVESVLWGFDINNQAVQLTRFSLLLRFLSNENKERIEEVMPILPSLKRNIVCANGLITNEDIDVTFVSREELFEIMPMDSSDEKNYMFDAVVGNPPYLMTEDIISSTPKAEINSYKVKFKSLFKQYDKYFLFIERSLQLLKDNGFSVLLVPNKFFTNNAGEKLRELLMEKGYIDKIFDFGVMQLFDGVINYVSVLKLRKNKTDSFEYIKVSSIGDVYKNKQGVIYEFEKLEKDYWFLTGDIDFKNQYYYTMQNFPCIEEEVEATNGIQTSKNSVYIIKENEIICEDNDIVRFKKKGIQYEIEKGILREYYAPPKGKGIKKSYQNIKATAYVIFPYEQGQLIPDNEIIDNYPKAWSYLNDYKEDLLPKNMGGNRDVKGSSEEVEWYQFGRTQALKENDRDKIIVGVMSSEPNFNIDRSNMAFSSGGTAGYISLSLREDSKYSLEYIQAWLSHVFTDRIFQTIGSDFEGGFYTHGTGLYKSIPLLPVNFEDDNEKSIHDEITCLVQEITPLNIEIEKESDPKKVKLLDMVKEDTIAKINKKIDELFNIKVKI